MANLKEKYALLKKKYSLPDYGALNQEFMVEDISIDTELVLQKIRHTMTDKVEFFAKMLENRLQPEGSLGDLYEAHNVDDDEKNDAYAIFKKLMYVIRYSSFVALSNNDEDNAKFIKDAFEIWNSVKPDLQVHIKKLLDLWKKETDIKDDLSYLG